jgi:phage gp16-like protein
MSSSTERVAQLRSKRKQLGMKQSTIWLSPEDEERILAIVSRKGFKTRTDGIRYALQQAFNQETEMQT